MRLFFGMMRQQILMEGLGGWRVADRARPGQGRDMRDMKLELKKKEKVFWSAAFLVLPGEKKRRGFWRKRDGGVLVERAGKFSGGGAERGILMGSHWIVGLGGQQMIV